MLEVALNLPENNDKKEALHRSHRLAAKAGEARTVTAKTIIKITKAAINFFFI
jgi:hypothetical protein